MNPQDPNDSMIDLEEDGITPPVVETTPVTRTGDRRRSAATVIGTLLVGGIAGAAILGPLGAAAASPTASAAASPAAAAASGDPDVPGVPDGGPGGLGGHDGGPGGLGGHVEAVSDASVAAKAIGISEADLTTALQGGQTIAAVAKAHNVAVQTVIDAYVADGLSELAAQVKSGAITQAQADAQKAAVTQRATDQVNGTFGGGRP